MTTHCRIDLSAGVKGPEFYWYREFPADFPKLLRHKGLPYEWVMYEKAEWPEVVDYILRFAALSTYDPNYYADMPTLDETIGAPAVASGCECGATHTPNSNCHATWCPEWKSPR